MRRFVPNPEDVDDVVQDVFYELVVAYRLMKPVERVGAWLYRVARNRLTDRFRRRRFVGEMPAEVVAPASDVLLAGELGSALASLTEEQREVFVAHEVEGISFAELSAETGIKVNTLLSRKHAAVTRLRERLKGAV